MKQVGKREFIRAQIDEHRENAQYHLRRGIGQLVLSAIQTGAATFLVLTNNPGSKIETAVAGSTAILVTGAAITAGLGVGNVSVSNGESQAAAALEGRLAQYDLQPHYHSNDSPE
jgi:hypothetical protein